MIRPAFFLAICFAASTTAALADQACPPITNLVSTGAVSYVAYPCAPMSLLDSELRCSNCPASQVLQPVKAQQPMCFKVQPNYVTVTVYRHLKNGKCVPIAGAFDRKRAVPKPAQALAGPIAPASPPRVAPVQAPPAVQAPPVVHAPPAMRAPIARAPLTAAPMRIEVPHTFAAPSRPQPTKPI